jgi:hypothetical protein
MANRNDDIKQLFSHLGLNEEDYRELRRQGGGTEAERVTRSAPATGAAASAGTAAPKTATPRSTASSVRSGSRFNAQSQPRVYLPGLTPENPHEEPPPVRVDALTSAPPLSPPSPSKHEAAAAPPLPPAEPVAPSAAVAEPVAPRRWPLLEAAAERPAQPARIAPPAMTDLPETRHFASRTSALTPAERLAAMPKATEAVRSAAMSLGERLRLALPPRAPAATEAPLPPPAADPGPVAASNAAAPRENTPPAAPTAAKGAGGLSGVLSRLREARPKPAAANAPRRLQYPGRSLTAVTDSPDAQDALNDVFHRINRPRR